VLRPKPAQGLGEPWLVSRDAPSSTASTPHRDPQNASHFRSTSLAGFCVRPSHEKRTHVTGQNVQMEAPGNTRVRNAARAPAREGPRPRTKDQFFSSTRAATSAPCSALSCVCLLAAAPQERNTSATPTEGRAIPGWIEGEGVGRTARRAAQADEEEREGANAMGVVPKRRGKDRRLCLCRQRRADTEADRLPPTPGTSPSKAPTSTRARPSSSGTLTTRHR